MLTPKSNSPFGLEKKIKLVDGQFTKVEALDIVSSLIDQKINFHKVELLCWDHKNQLDKTAIRNRIEDLQAEKDNFKNYIKEIEGQGKIFKITGNLDIQILS